MPIYDYKCTKGHVYEKTEGFDAPSQQKCVKCGSAARRQISMPAVIFKGSGFYSTDNRKSDGSSSPDSSPSKDGDSGASSNGASSDSGSSDGGSESKAEAATAD